MKGKIELDTKDLFDKLEKKLIQTHEITQIVNEVAEILYKEASQLVPYDTGQAYSHFSISEIRVYPNQTWISIGFDKEWESWKQAYFLNYDVRSPHYHWFTNYIRGNKAKAQKLLEQKAKALIDSKK